MPDSLQPAHAHACRQDEQQVARVKYSNIGGDKTQTDEINRFLHLLSQRRPKLSLTHFAKLKENRKLMKLITESLWEVTASSKRGLI